LYLFIYFSLQVQNKSSKILGKKGTRSIGTLTSAERGFTTTATISMSATGHFVPPMLIFKRVNMNENLKFKAPSGTLFGCHKSGWMQTDLFTKWFKHFIEHTNPSELNPILLILDGHATHTRNIVFIKMAIENFVTVICLPPHCSHKLQPLDVSFMGPLKNFYSIAIETFLRKNPGKRITQYNVSEIFGEAYEKASSVSNAISGFKKTGIYPLDKKAFNNNDFVAADSLNMQKDIDVKTNEITTRPFPFISPEEIRSYPKASPIIKTNVRQKGESTILTTTAYLQTLEDKIKLLRKEPDIKKSSTNKKRKKTISPIDAHIDSHMDTNNTDLFCDTHYDTHYNTLNDTQNDTQNDIEATLLLPQISVENNNGNDSNLRRSTRKRKRKICFLCGED
jgi:hypothetical protein